MSKCHSHFQVQQNEKPNILCHVLKLKAIKLSKFNSHNLSWLLAYQSELAKLHTKAYTNIWHEYNATLNSVWHTNFDSIQMQCVIWKRNNHDTKQKIFIIQCTKFVMTTRVQIRTCKLYRKANTNIWYEYNAIFN